MRGAWILALGCTGLPGVVAAEASPFGACVDDAMAAFEDRLDAALNSQAAPNFDLVGGEDVGDCAGLALLLCGTQEPCRGDAVAEVGATIDAVLAQVPAPEAVAGRNPVWSDGLYPRLWRAASAPPEAGNAALVARLSTAASLWQVARAIGVVERGGLAR